MTPSLKAQPPSKEKDRTIATLLAFTGVILPIAGFHKFYLGQPRWGLAYLLLSLTPIPRVASALEGLWYLFQGSDQFNRLFNPENSIAASAAAPTKDRAAQPNPSQLDQVTAVATALRQLEQLRQEGLITDYEFETKRRQLLDRLT